MPGITAGSARVPGDRGARARIVLALLFAATYSAWLLEAALGDEVSVIWGFVSELAAGTQPHGAFFAAADGVAGAIAAALAVAWGLRRPPARTAAAGLAAWGIATVLDSLARMPAVEVTPDRRGLLPGPGGAATQPPAAPEGGPFGSITGPVHEVTSSVAQVGLVAAIVGLMIAVPRLRRGARGVLSAVALALAAMTIASSALYELAGVNIMLGLWQRAGLLAAVTVVGSAAIADARARGQARAGNSTGRTHRTA